MEPGHDQSPLPTVIDVPQPGHSGNVITSDGVPSRVAVHGGKVLVGEGASRLRSTAATPMQGNKEIFWESKNVIGTRRHYVQAPP